MRGFQSDSAHLSAEPSAHRSSKCPFSGVKQISAVLRWLVSLTLIVQEKNIYLSIRELYFQWRYQDVQIHKVFLFVAVIDVKWSMISIEPH